MIKYPFQKLIIYLAVLSRFDSAAFGESCRLYLPSIVFNFEDPLQYIKELLEKEPIPKPILSGNYNIHVLKIFAKQQNLISLHSAWEQPEFLDIVFNTDLRRKLDGMSMSPVFRKLDIIHEFPEININFLDAYLDGFSNFKEVSNLPSYVDKYIGDKNEKLLYKRILENTSRQYLKVALNIKLPEISPKELIEHALNIVTLKLQESFLSENNIEIDRWIKLQVSISEKLHRMGAGNKSDVDELMELLKGEKDFDEPVIYTKEQLEEQYQKNQILENA